MRQLLVTRHAESEFNASGRINADPSIPCPLTKAGKRQARALGELLAADPIDVCLTSEHERAIATADIALRERAVPRFVMPELNEPQAGALEGALASAYEGRLRRDGPDSPNPGGESQLDALRRYVSAYRRIAGRPEPVALVVAHSLPVGWLRSATEVLNGGAAVPSVDFARPGIAFAGPPDRYRLAELRDALTVLDRRLGDVQPAEQSPDRGGALP